MRSPLITRAAILVFAGVLVPWAAVQVAGLMYGQSSDRRSVRIPATRGWIIVEAPRHARRGEVVRLELSQAGDHSQPAEPINPRLLLRNLDAELKTRTPSKWGWDLRGTALGTAEVSFVFDTPTFVSPGDRVLSSWREKGVAIDPHRATLAIDVLTASGLPALDAALASAVGLSAGIMLAAQLLSRRS